MNHVLILDDVLSDKECDAIVNVNTTKLSKELNTYPWNYNYSDMVFDEILNRVASTIINSYIDKFPDVNKTKDRWLLESFRFKEFQPGKFYEGWHSEHCYEYPYRIFCAIVYLSDHNCGTEFSTGEVIQSKKGRVAIFPTLWTHTHRGQPCPDNRVRYIMNAYASLQPRT